MMPGHDVLVVCETLAAIVLHLRLVGDGEINYNGRDAYAETLCGSDVGWDTKDDPTEVTCRECQTIVINRSTKGKANARTNR